MPIGPGWPPPSPLCRNSASSKLPPGLSGPNRSGNLTSLQIEGLPACDGGTLKRGEGNLVVWTIPSIPRPPSLGNDRRVS